MRSLHSPPATDPAGCSDEIRKHTMSTAIEHAAVTPIVRAIDDAMREGLRPGTDRAVLTGLSGEALVGALQRFVGLLPQSGDLCYCEIGVFQGLTLLSTASANPSTPCFGIDNFSQFDVDGANERIVKERAKSLRVENARVVNADYEAALANAEHWLEGRRIGVYFVDGPHDYRSQIVCLLRAKSWLAPGALIVVDDCNYEHVRQANADFLRSHSDYALLFEAYTPCHPANMRPEERADAIRGWWNGVNILVHDPAHALPRRVPPTRSPQLHLMSHDVYRAEFASIAVEAMRFCGVLCDANDDDVIRHVRQFRTLVQSTRRAAPHRFPWQNTDSRELPVNRWHVALDASVGQRMDGRFHA